MAHTDERKRGVLDILNTKADGNTSRCARLTGVDRKTIQKWKQEQESSRQEREDSGELPEAAQIKEKIIRRVYQIIDTCTDPKKLMDAYEAISKLEGKNGPKESIFDVIEQNLREE